MKINLTLSLLFVILFTSNSYTQNKYSEIKIGVNVGAVTHSKFKGDTTKINFLIGTSFDFKYLGDIILTRINLNYVKNSIIQTEKQYSEFNQYTGVKDITVNLDHLISTIMAKYEFGDSKKIFINAGPFASFLLNPNPNRQRVNAGLSLGIGTKISINDKSRINIELRNDFGLKNISNDDDNQTLKTNSINLILNWDFEI